MADSSDAFYEIDLKGWPLVQVIMTESPQDDEDFDGFQDAFIGLLQGVIDDQAENDHTDRISVVMEMDGLVEASFAQQLRGVGFIRAVRPLVADTIRCTALVIGSPAVRAIVEFILGLQPLQSEHAVFSNTADALAWCDARKDV